MYLFYLSENALPAQGKIQFRFSGIHNPSTGHEVSLYDHSPNVPRVFPFQYLAVRDNLCGPDLELIAGLMGSMYAQLPVTDCRLTGAQKSCMCTFTLIPRPLEFR